MEIIDKKKAHRESQKRYYLKNKDKISIRLKKYTNNNREKLSLKRKEYYNKNKDVISSNQKNYYNKNSEKKKVYRETRKEIKAIWYKDYYKKNESLLKNKSKKYSLDNKDKRKLSAKKYHIDHRDEISKRVKEYRLKFKEEIKRKQSLYCKNNRSKINIKKEVKYKNDINYRLSVLLRGRLNKAIKGNYKTGSAVRDLGCSIGDFKEYLFNLFKWGMNWDNQGEWHIDHIIPLSSFNLENREELLKACHYTNLQPLWSYDNISKGNKIVGRSL